MFYVIESEYQVERMKQLVKEDCFVEVITNNDNYHPILSHPILVYIRPRSEKHGYVLPLEHPECLNLSYSVVKEILQSITRVFTRDKKRLLYFYNLKNVIDLNLLHSMVYFTKLESDFQTPISTYHHSRNPDSNILNKLIPISKLFETYENVYDRCKTTIDTEIPQGFTFYNDLGTKVFYLIEQTGLGIYYKEFNELFTPKNPIFNIKDNTVYTYFNLYNPTSRPTNSFNSVNFSALPKQEEYRKCFYPKNDRFITYDYDGYHIRLFCELIDYPLTGESAHLQLAKKYFNKSTLTEEEYSKAKQINFQALYGNIPKEVAHYEFFTKTNTFINKLWSEFQENGFIQDPISGKAFTPTLKEINSKKLFNYYMQSLETSTNLVVLKNVLNYLKDKSSTLSLYVYDAIVLDVSDKDGEKIIQEIKQIVENGNRFPTKIYESMSLNF